MAPKSRIIIDTDAGGDDIIAILLALTASAEDIEILLLSVVWGNVNVDKGLKTIVSLFHIAKLEMRWREARGVDVGFDSLRAYRPVVAVGAAGALGSEEVFKDDGFHGPDGVGGFHTTHPHLSPPDTWKHPFDVTQPRPSQGQVPSYFKYFTPATTPAHKEILRILKTEPAGTVTVCSMGPMTNMALAAVEDPETFLRMKDLLVMGGAVDAPGNITTVVEANIWNDALAAARVFALTSKRPEFTTPVCMRGDFHPYPENLPPTLDLKLFPLDITSKHYVDYSRFREVVGTQIKEDSPLATFVDTFLAAIHRKVRFQYGDNASANLVLHDGLTVWYALTAGSQSPAWALAPDAPEDIRVATTEEWTHGMTVVDRRKKRRADGVNETEIPGDSLGWLSSVRGNRVNVVVGSPGGEAYHEAILGRLFGV
ncbi:inosine-uridine preferring nucleoside hydrolase [Aspergillus stella-maris]|uniref:inosine-uridine preferring nucleoside hydrolase n=1 Tax=Aspergillus stella-maris TaxID=1810926 RepID=UPI003CCDB31A